MKSINVQVEAGPKERNIALINRFRSRVFSEQIIEEARRRRYRVAPFRARQIKRAMAERQRVSDMINLEKQLMAELKESGHFPLIYNK